MDTGVARPQSVLSPRKSEDKFSPRRSVDVLPTLVWCLVCESSKPNAARKKLLHHAAHRGGRASAPAWAQGTRRACTLPESSKVKLEDG